MSDAFRIELVDAGGPGSGGPAAPAGAPGSPGRDPHQQAARQATAQAAQTARNASAGILDVLPAGGGGNVGATAQAASRAAGGAAAAGASAAGAGAAAGGASAMMAAAGGPIGIAVAAVAAAKMVADKAKEMATEAVKAAAHFAQGMSRLDSSAFGDGMQTLVSNIPIVGGLFGQLTGQLRQFMNGLDETARRLAPYSGQLSQAQAMSDVRQTMGDFNRARKLGSELSAFVDARSRIDQAGQDVLATMLKPIIPIVTALLERIAVLLEGANAFAEESYDFIAESVNGTLAILEAIANAIPGVELDIGRIAKNTDRDANAEGGALEQLMASLQPIEALTVERIQQRKLRQLQAAAAPGM